MLLLTAAIPARGKEAFRTMFESLENRRLYRVSLVNGTLTVTGNDQKNYIDITLVNNQITVPENFQQIAAFDSALVGGVTTPTPPARGRSPARQ